MVFGTLLQILCFYLYNGPFHPFANILVDDTEGKNWFLILSDDCIFLSNFIVFFAEDSKLKPYNPSNDKMDADNVPQPPINPLIQKKLWTCPRNLQMLKLSLKKACSIPHRMKLMFETRICQDSFIGIIVFYWPCCWPHTCREGLS